MRDFCFFQNCGTFNTNQNKKYYNFERNENRATVFLKWTDFRRQKIYVDYCSFQFQHEHEISNMRLFTSTFYMKLRSKLQYTNIRTEPIDFSVLAQVTKKIIRITFWALWVSGRDLRRQWNPVWQRHRQVSLETIFLCFLYLLNSCIIFSPGPTTT